MYLIIKEKILWIGCVYINQETHDQIPAKARFFIYILMEGPMHALS